MRGREILATLHGRRTEEHRFVKWWRKENDFLDYDLIDRFIENTGSSVEIEGLELLTMDDMWHEVRRVGRTRVTLLHGAAGDEVTWSHVGKTGLHVNVCPYTAETLLEIFDVETKGNPVD